ncbi:hypothetical protein E4634_02595 [Mangrovimicrobium sediminis]|uniref:Transcriptional regulator SutA RNAP-binding domain-containing protein n=1 Tax=Mangrovimicrobium sediminis TaxID=2562682 RepID=A0A4Z0M8R8_9GAMM|nr:hypothetical protein [Haliea sp. SAOS-164]TGD75777.1 hypothetical protein E4634_02595 [Haliea sp. SAOS-164]
MSRNQQRMNESEKNRMREEIDAQIRDYLQRGGKIDVLASGQHQSGRSIGSVWHSEDMPQIEQ